MILQISCNQNKLILHCEKIQIICARNVEKHHSIAMGMNILMDTATVMTGNTIITATVIITAMDKKRERVTKQP